MSTTTFVAEYAKSNRSSCKKCSEKISTKALRLGSVTKDPRGYDATKWYHVGCFPSVSVSIDSVDTIQGFAELQSGDQEALKKLVVGNEGNKSLEENQVQKIDENEEEAGSEERNPKRSKVQKSDEEAEVVAEYAKSNRSSCKKCSEKISSKTLRLGSVTRDPRGYDATKWYHVNCFPSISELIDSVDSIKGFESLQSGDQEALKNVMLGIEYKKSLEEVPKTDKDADAEVVAEYAKSNRSSCKKCSEKILSKALRLGSLTRDPRGYDATKWYHVDCFPSISELVDSVDSIKGFESLQSGDQEALKKLLGEIAG